MADTDGSLESLMRWCRLGEAGHVNNDKLVVFVAAKDCYAVEKETEQLRKENDFLKSMFNCVRFTPRPVIDNQLLTVPDDEAKVAIIATEADLCTLINALGFFQSSCSNAAPEGETLCADLKTLQIKAFGNKQ